MCNIPTILFHFYIQKGENIYITAVPKLINNSPEVRNTLPHSARRRVGGLRSGQRALGDHLSWHPKANALGNCIEALSPRPPPPARTEAAESK